MLYALISIGGVALCVGCFFLYRWLRSRRGERDSGPDLDVFRNVWTSPTSPPAKPSTPGDEDDTAGDTKDRLLGRQRQKYEARLADATDELTSHQRALQKNEWVKESAREQLSKVGKKLLREVRAELRRRAAKDRQALISALLLRPLYRLLKRLPVGWRFVVLSPVVWFAYVIYRDWYDGAWIGLLVLVVFVFAMVVPILFAIERRQLLSPVLKAIKDDASNFEHLRFYYLVPYEPPPGEGDSLKVPILRLDTEGAWDDETWTMGRTKWAKHQLGDGGGMFSIVHDSESILTYRISEHGHIEPTYTGTSFAKKHHKLIRSALERQTSELLDIRKLIHQYATLQEDTDRLRGEVSRLESLLSQVRRLESIWEEVYADPKVLEAVLKRVDLFNVRSNATPPGILLFGPTGNGKEFLARKIAESVFARFIEVSIAETQSAEDVKKIWSRAKRGGPAVLYVEYAERLFPAPDSTESRRSRSEVTAAWVEEWDDHPPAESDVWVIMSAASGDALHPRVLQHFSSARIPIPSPDRAGRALILEAACIRNEVSCQIPSVVLDLTEGATILELRNIVKEALMHAYPDSPTEKLWRKAVRTIRGTDDEFRDRTKTWDRLVLAPEIEAELQQLTKILRNAKAYKERGVNVPSVLLFGPPGTGKTDIARTLANEGGIKFTFADGTDMKGKYTGQSAHHVKDVFAKARQNAPCILFIDELDAPAARRGSRFADTFTRDIVAQMLTEMEGVKRNDAALFILAATNRPEDIDEAVLNRFGRKIEIGLPDEPARAEILVRLLRERPVDPAMNLEEVAALVAKRTARKSGRDLVNLVDAGMGRATMDAASPSDVVLRRKHLLGELTPQKREVSDEKMKQIWSKIVLETEVQDTIVRKVKAFNRAGKAAPRGLLLYGPPGTGKTQIAKRIAESTNCYFMELKGPDLKAAHIGGSGQSVKKIWEQARARGRCIMFIDDCEGVFGRRGAVDSDSASDEIVEAFLPEWEGMDSDGQVWVIGATNRRELLDEAIMGRFGSALEIKMPDAAARMEILRLELVKHERQVYIPAFVEKLTTGFSGRKLAMVVRELASMADEREAGIAENDWRVVLERQREASKESVDESARWDSLILQPDTLGLLQTICSSLRHVEALKEMGVHPPTGALLYGPPGTGKTQIARTMANEAGVSFFAASTADLKAGFLGQSGQAVKTLLQRARAGAPSILFIDDFEAVAPSRVGADSDKYTQEIVTQLLPELDGVKKSDRHVFVLAATNYPELIDSALLDRFEYKIEVPNPGAPEREQLFRLFLSKQKALSKEPGIDELAELLTGLAGEISGRDIGNLVKRASQRAVMRALADDDPSDLEITHDDLIAEVHALKREGGDTAHDQR